MKRYCSSAILLLFHETDQRSPSWLHMEEDGNKLSSPDWSALLTTLTFWLSYKKTRNPVSPIVLLTCIPSVLFLPLQCEIQEVYEACPCVTFDSGYFDIFCLVIFNIGIY